MPDAELTVAAAAELLQVSEDTVRALIRSKHLPATRHRARGAYVLTESDVRAAKENRAHSLIAGKSTPDAVELAELVADELELRALRARVKAVETRRNHRARAIRAGSGAGYGAVTDMANAVDLHRTVVQRWLSGDADPDAVTDAEKAADVADEAWQEQLRSVERARADARA